MSPCMWQTSCSLACAAEWMKDRSERPEGGVRQLNTSTQFGPGEDRTFQVLWEDNDRVFGRASRRDADGRRHDVLVVLPAADYPTAMTLARLTHEYALKDALDGSWAVRPLELIRDRRGQTMLVLEDSGSEPLDRLLGAPMEIGGFLRLAVGIAVALGKLHQAGLVHKDVKPANILVHRAGGKVRLTGFGVASRLPRERQAPEPPETIAGTLAYMAPEQTGRMNRSVDTRSDLYALGITFYQMLTGTLAVHCRRSHGMGALPYRAQADLRPPSAWVSFRTPSRLSS